MSGPLFWKPTQGRGSSARVGSTPPPPGPPVSGYALWLSDTGSDPGVWPDQSGNGHDAVQPTVASQPAIVSGALAGKQGRLFDGVDDQIATINIDLVQPLSYFIVYAFSSPPSTEQVLVDGSSQEVAILAKSTGVLSFYAGGFQDSSVQVGDVPNVTSFTLLTGNLNGYQNGVAVISGNAGTNNPGGIIIGAGSGGVLFASATIYEILIYPSVLSDSDRKSVQSYLGTKWGIPLGQPQITLLDFTGLTGSNFVTAANGIFCQISAGISNTQYSPWVNTGTESNPGNPNGVEVDVLVADFDSELAMKFGAAMGATGAWTVSGSGAQVILTDNDNCAVGGPNQDSFPVAPVVTQAGTANS